MVDGAASERELLEVGGAARRRAAGASPQPAEGGRRQGDGPRLAGRGAQGRAVPLRRRRAGLPLARRPRAPPHRLPAARSRSRPPPIAVAMKMGNTPRGPRRARRRRRRGRPPHGAPLHRRRDARRPRSACLRDLWKDGVASSVDLLGEATVTQAEAERYAEPLRGGARHALPTPRARWPDAPAARARLRRAAPAREPVGQGVRAHAAAAPRRARARQARRRRPPARAAAPRARARRAPAHRHGVDGLARRGARARARAARRGRSSATARRPAWCCRPTCATRRRRSTRSLELGAAGAERAHAADRPAGQGRLLGPRDRRGRASTAGTRPVFEVKADSDRNFEALTRRLLDARRRRRGVRVAIASHNLRSVAHAIAYNRLRAATTATSSCRCCAASATRCRRRSPPRACACAPTARSATSWRAWPTSCGACSRTPPTTPSCADQARGRAARGAARPPRVTGLKPFAQRADARAAPRAGARAARRRARARSTPALPLRVPVWIGDERARGRRARLDRPGRARARRRAGRGRDARTRSTRRWRPRGAARATGRRRRRASAPSVLLRAAQWLRERRLELAALEVRECAKPWPEADADVCEAIDFLEYYARGAVELERGRAELLQLPGRAQHACAARPRGVVAVISPWNFPLAIPLRDDRRRPGDRQRRRAQAGRAGARLRATCSCGRCARPACRRTRSSLLPGEGDVGAALVARPARAHDRLHRLERGRAGDRPQRGRDAAPGQKHLKRVVAEMGGKNCVIVDSDADLDEVVPALVRSRVRLRRPEVLGGRARARARGDPRRAARAPRRRRRGARGRPGGATSTSTCRR